MRAGLKTEKYENSSVETNIQQIKEYYIKRKTDEHSIKDNETPKYEFNTL